MRQKSGPEKEPASRSRLPKEWQGLGISDTVEEAKALCERHFAATARREK
jgi:hypothetical protein